MIIHPGIIILPYPTFPGIKNTITDSRIEDKRQPLFYQTGCGFLQLFLP
jgi:hypothetical protein